MKFHLNRTIDIRETGLVLQPKLFWLAAGPDSLVSDKSNEDVMQIGLREIKCLNLRKLVRLMTWYMFSHSMLNMTMEYHY